MQGIDQQDPNAQGTGWLRNYDTCYWAIAGRPVAGPVGDEVAKGVPLEASAGVVDVSNWMGIQDRKGQAAAHFVESDSGTVT